MRFDHATVRNEDKMLNLIHMLTTRIDSLEMEISASISAAKECTRKASRDLDPSTKQPVMCRNVVEMITLQKVVQPPVLTLWKMLLGDPSTSTAHERMAPMPI